MRTSLLLSILICSVAWADEPKKDDPVQPELKKLEGTWVVEGAFVRGLEIRRHHGSQFVFMGTTMTSNLDGKEESGEIKIDPTKKVKEMDFLPDAKKDPTGKIALGIYVLDGDSLKLCIGDEKKRPTKITKDDLLYILKRKK